MYSFDGWIAELGLRCDGRSHSQNKAKLFNSTNRDRNGDPITSDGSSCPELDV